MLSSEAVSVGLFDGIMGTSVAEFQEELEKVTKQVGSYKIEMFCIYFYFGPY